MTEIDTKFIERASIKILFVDDVKRDIIFPYLNKDLYLDERYNKIISEYLDFYKTYKVHPTIKDFKYQFSNNEEIYEAYREIMMTSFDGYTKDFLLSEIENLYRQLLTLSCLSDFNDKLRSNKLTEIDEKKLSKAKSFTFQQRLGLNPFLDDGEVAYNIIHSSDEFIPTSLQQFNKFMGGGLLKSGLTLFVAGTNVGKTLIKCALATDLLLQGKNVLYITLEMIDKRIVQRNIINMLKTSVKDLRTLSKDDFIKKWNELKSKITGNITVCDFPAKSFNVEKFRSLISDLENKNEFKPDVIFIDYLGLMNPSFIQKESNSNSMLKQVAEELHGESKILGVPIVSSMQFNRQGMKSSDPDLDQISESIGTVFTADEVVLVIQPDELLEERKYKLLKAKSRTTIKNIFTYLSVDYDTMSVSEVNENEIKPTDTLEISKNVSIINNNENDDFGIDL